MQRTASITTPAEFGRVPDFQLQLQIQRHIAEGRAFHADVTPLAVLQPGHIVGRADVHILGADIVVESAR